ncbi:unnamed protein product [Closterium sp. NIES-54]
MCLLYPLQACPMHCTTTTTTVQLLTVLVLMYSYQQPHSLLLFPLPLLPSLPPLLPSLHPLPHPHLEFPPGTSQTTLS